MLFYHYFRILSFFYYYFGLFLASSEKQSINETQLHANGFPKRFSAGKLRSAHNKGRTLKTIVLLITLNRKCLMCIRT